jgi:quercetin dioxygenase-like cupin family protein
MNIIDITSLGPISSGASRFEGGNYGSSISCFVVKSATGEGADKHRHPYEETFVLLEGDIEAIVDGKMQMIQAGNIVVVPANTWHEFKNRSEHPALMVNIHPVPKILLEYWEQ